MNAKSALIPWQDESELAMVRDWFFPAQAVKDPYDAQIQEDMRREAVARVSVWTFKSYEVSPAVLSTADLTDSLLHYEDLTRSRDPNSYRATQFMFAFAFLRFVNAFVDRDVARTAATAVPISDTEMEDDRVVKSAGETSMYAHAVAIGMPSRFVDLRHQVSHGAVPEVKTLKKAADEALLWLWNKWWKSNATGDSAVALARFKARREQVEHNPNQQLKEGFV